LLVVEIATTALRTCHQVLDTTSFGSAVLAEVAEGTFASCATSLLSELLDRNRNRLTFMCIAVGEGTQEALEAAEKWGRAGQVAGAGFIIGSIVAAPAAYSAHSLLNSCDTLLFTSDPDALFHAPRLLLEQSQLIGYDAADLMQMWRQRTGWIERSVETKTALTAAVDRARSHFDTAMPTAALVLFTANESGPTLAQRDDLVTGLDKLLDGRADLLVAANKPIWEHDLDTVEVSCLFDAECLNP
jgi:hypothetical protein